MFGKKKFYYNLKTGEVEEGRQSSWTDLMGPYPTRQAAEHALEIARARTQEWDAAEQTWTPSSGDDKPSQPGPAQGWDDDD